MATQPTVGVVTKRFGSGVWKDATGTPISLTLGPGPGDFSFDGAQEGFADTTAVLNRGVFLERVKGDDKPLTVTVTLYDVGDATGHSAFDAILKTGDFASGVTTDPGGLVWSGTLVFTTTRNSQVNIYTFSYARPMPASYKEATEGNTVSLSFECFGLAIT